MTIDTSNIPSAGYIRGGVHILPVRIYYEDTDFSGMVYHANYLRYCERGRSDLLRLLGYDHTTLAARSEPLAVTVRKIEIEYLIPARIDDALEVHSSFTDISGARVLVQQDIKRGEHMLARARLETVCISPEGRPRRVPPDFAAALERARTKS